MGCEPGKITMTLLALDIGAKRIGLAVGSIVPFGRGTIDASSEDHVLAHLGQLIATEHVDGIVVGVPQVKSGDATESVQRAKVWGERIETAFSLPVYYVDEAFSSRQAEAELRAQGVATEQDKGAVDERCAELILAQYLNEG